MAIKNLTYYNFMVVMHKIEKKGYTSQEAEKMTRRIFDEYTPAGLSIEARINMILPKEAMR